MKKTTLGVYAIALGSIALWGLSYIWCDRILALGIPVEYFVPIRILVAGIILFVVNLIMGCSMRIRKDDTVMFLLLALFEPFIYFFCETYGIQFTGSPTISALVRATTPIFAIIAGRIFFSEESSWHNWAGIAVCLGGLALVTGTHGSVGRLFWFGLAVLLIAVIAEVGHSACTKRLADSYAPTVIVMYQFLIGTVYFIPMFLTRGMENFDGSVYLSIDFFKPMMALAVLCSAVAFSLWAKAIQKLGLTRACIFLAMIPIATALWGFVLGDEQLRPLQWIGLAVACGGIVLTQLRGKVEA